MSTSTLSAASVIPASRETPVEVRNDPAGKVRRIGGYAAKFGVMSASPLWPGGRFEIISSTAFDKSLAAGDEVLARVQHQGGLHVLGRSSNGTLRLRKDSVGLVYEVDLPDTQAGRDVYELVKRGDIKSSSFAFKVRDYEDTDRGDKPVRILTDVMLVDVAPVDSPAYQDTSVSARKKDEPAPEPPMLAGETFVEYVTRTSDIRMQHADIWRSVRRRMQYIIKSTSATRDAGAYLDDTPAEIKPVVMLGSDRKMPKPDPLPGHPSDRRRRMETFLHEIAHGTVAEALNVRCDWIIVGGSEAFCHHRDCDPLTTALIARAGVIANIINAEQDDRPGDAEAWRAAWLKSEDRRIELDAWPLTDAHIAWLESQLRWHMPKLLTLACQLEDRTGEPIDCDTIVWPSLSVPQFIAEDINPMRC